MEGGGGDDAGPAPRRPEAVAANGAASSNAGHAPRTAEAVAGAASSSKRQRTNAELLSQLERLVAWHAEGVLSTPEFQKAKAALGL